MEKSLMLFLSFLLLYFSCNSQSINHYPKCDCSRKAVQDSLIRIYIDNGTQKSSYNDIKWELYCDSLIEICPNIAIAYQQKALPYIKNGDYAIAFPLENKAVELDAQNYTAYRGFLKCIFTKDYEGAIIDFTNAQRLNPNGFKMDHTYFFYQGLCNLELKNYEEAKENFKRDTIVQQSVIPGENIHFNSLLYIGILYYEMKDNYNSKCFLLRCLKQYKELPEANYYLALLYKNEGNSEDYQKYLQIAIWALNNGYSMNEDNTYYAYYPHQITLYEIENEIAKK